MTERTTNIASPKEHDTFKKLSIQISLNGLSFCVVDTLIPKLLAFEHVTFTTPSTPYLLLKELKSFLNRNRVMEHDFSEVTVIHKNKLFSLVPKPLFITDKLSNYLKFNAKLMADDHIVYDEIPHQDIVNVYVPYANINNYIFDCFGEFEFIHSGTVLINTLFNQNRGSVVPVCYVQVAEREMEMAVISEKKLLFYNQFEYKTPEDFLYYVLFSLEQVQVGLEHVRLSLFGHIAEGNVLYEGCSRYIKHVSVFESGSFSSLWKGKKRCVDFTVLSTL